jgi:putative flippase GtrA
MGYLQALLRTALVQKLVKYSAASAAGVLVGQATLIFCLEALEWPALAANMASITLGCIPNYTINRYWTWQQSGQNRLWGEVIPFWCMAAAGAALSMLAVAFADAQWGTTLAVAIANLAGFGVLWVAKFLVLDKLMWKVVHDLHPEVEIDAAEAGLPGALDLDEAQAQAATTNGNGSDDGSALGGAVTEQVGQAPPPR